MVERTSLIAFSSGSSGSVVKDFLGSRIRLMAEEMMACPRALSGKELMRTSLNLAIACKISGLVLLIIVGSLRGVGRRAGFGC